MKYEPTFYSTRTSRFDEPTKVFLFQLFLDMVVSILSVILFNKRYSQDLQRH